MSGGDALISVSNSISTFGSTIAAALAPPSSDLSATIHRNHAIDAAITQETSLTKLELARLIDCFRKEESIVGVYLTLSDPDLREEWVRLQLNT